MRYGRINKNLFIKNRKKYLSQVPDESVSIFTSNDILPTNADGSFGFIQNSTFYYLTGVDQEDCYLVLVKGKGEWLFVKETSDLIMLWDGKKLSQEEASDISGINNVLWTSELWPFLKGHVADVRDVFIYRDTTQLSRFPSFRSKSTWFYEAFQREYPLIEISNSERVVNQLRLIKESEELEALQKAVDITHKGLLRAAKFLKPGTHEFEVEAEIMHELMNNRSRFHAFTPIIAAGANACVLHYVENNSICKDGDLLLIDFGAEYANYKADMTRVLPVNGKFSPRQAEVYTSVLNVLKAVRAQMQVGNTLGELKKEAKNLVSKELVKLKLVTESELKNNPEVVLKYFPHGPCHFLGLDVHDVGDRELPIEAGMVLTCEPAIYIQEEGIGIRLENDILITESGNIDLMEGVPLEIEEIENIMKHPLLNFRHTGT